MSQSHSDYIIEFRAVSKKYGPLYANQNLDLRVRRGSVHGIIGENGAGKSTAMKILFGVEAPTSGEVFFNGNARVWDNPRGALAAGVGMVHQHFMLSPVHSALDNVILGASQSHGGALSEWVKPLDRATVLRALDRVCAEVGFSIPWSADVGSLPVGIQQQIEIVKLLYAGVNVMIFDEPTAVLSPDETSRFLGLITRLNQAGKTIILISHKLREIRAVAHDVTVIRKGASVGTVRASEVSEQGLADLMVGRHVRLGSLARGADRFGDVAAELKNVSLPKGTGTTGLSHLSLRLRAGEILGVAGVEGNGQNDLFRSLRDPASVSRLGSGAVSLFGRASDDLNASDVRRMSVAIVPGDRLREAVLPQETLLENDYLGHDSDFAVGPEACAIFLNEEKASARLQRVLDEYDVRPADPSAPLGGLSGGNQQKFVMARELSRDPRLLLVAQPTRGVDVGSIERIYSEILRRRDQGSAVLLISSQLEELMELADRIIVMYEGRIVAEFPRGQFDEGAIGLAMGGAGR